MTQLVWLIPLGLGVGAFGTLIGAGGGFILVPLLLLIYPEKSPSSITSISLAVVFFNALSGSHAYVRMKRVDFKSGGMFALATIPGAIIGANVVGLIPRHMFDSMFGTILVALSIYLWFKKNSEGEVRLKAPRYHVSRTLTDSDGNTFSYSYNPAIGIISSLGVGFFSSILGIGGGIIHVPVMAHLLDFPVHIATATSHFVLSTMALTGSLVHVANGDLEGSGIIVLGISIGVIFGAQIGAMLSKKIKGYAILRALAVELALVGIRILVMGLV